MRTKNHWGSELLDRPVWATSRSCTQKTLRSLASFASIRGAAVLCFAATVSVGSLAGEVNGQPSTAQKETSAVGTWLSLDKELLEAKPLPESGLPPKIGSSPGTGSPPRVGTPLEPGEDRRSVTAQTSTRSQGLSRELGPPPAASGQTLVARSVADSFASAERATGPVRLSPLPFTVVPNGAPTVKLERVRMAPLRAPPTEPAPSPRTAGPLYMGAPPRIGLPPKLVPPPGTVSLPENKAGERD